MQAGCKCFKPYLPGIRPLAHTLHPAATMYAASVLNTFRPAVHAPACTAVHPLHFSCSSQCPGSRRAKVLRGQEEREAPRHVNNRAAESSSQQQGSSQTGRPYQTPTSVVWLVHAVQCKHTCKQSPTTQTTGSRCQLHSRLTVSVTPDLADACRQAPK